jgi:hypothetical protein
VWPKVAATDEATVENVLYGLDATLALNNNNDDDDEEEQEDDLLADKANHLESDDVA